MVDISIIVMCDVSYILEYDRKTSELSSAPLHMEQYTTSIEK